MYKLNRDTFVSIARHWYKSRVWLHLLVMKHKQTDNETSYLGVFPEAWKFCSGSFEFECRQHLQWRRQIYLYGSFKKLTWQMTQSCMFFISYLGSCSRHPLRNHFRILFYYLWALWGEKLCQLHNECRRIVEILLRILESLRSRSCRPQNGTQNICY